MASTRHWFASACFVVTILLAQAAPAATEAEIEAIPGDAPRSLLGMSPEQAAKLEPCDQEIRTLLLKERDEIAALTILLKDVSDNMAALEIQKEISAKKQVTEIGIMEIQAKYAAQAGRHEQAAAIREMVAGMKERLAATRSVSDTKE